jgi:phenylpyruvate tautomerase PptA (4-oxalocrotonate tautomerase family)
MPLVMIDLLEGREQRELDAICGAIQEAMVENFDVPRRDEFQILTEHPPAKLRFNRAYLDIDRSEGFVMVRIILAGGRTSDAKRAFYKHLSDLLAERVDLRAEDLSVVLIENGREDWSFGLGQASYLELPRDAWR